MHLSIIPDFKVQFSNLGERKRQPAAISLVCHIGFKVWNKSKLFFFWNVVQRNALIIHEKCSSHWCSLFERSYEHHMKRLDLGFTSDVPGWGQGKHFSYLLICSTCDFLLGNRSWVPKAGMIAVVFFPPISKQGSSNPLSHLFYVHTRGAKREIEQKLPANW